MSDVLDSDSPRCEWYFDFVSPYAYLSSLQLHRLAGRVQLGYRPILFAALLNHWEQKGPAEIAAKRKWTYRSVTWLAQRHRIPFRMPAVHPFNPLSYLRLAHAADCAPHAIDLIFRTLWTTGADPRDESVPDALMRELGLDRARIEDRAIKDALRHATDDAIKAGVFGVPTFRVRDQLFWGSDSMSFVEDFLAHPDLFDQAQMQEADRIPIGAERST